MNPLHNHETFDENGRLSSQEYEKRIGRLLDEFDWYLEAFHNQKGTPSKIKIIIRSAK